MKVKIGPWGIQFEFPIPIKLKLFIKNKFNRNKLAMCENCNYRHLKDERIEILEKYRPDVYLPLEKDFCVLSYKPICNNAIPFSAYKNEVFLYQSASDNPTLSNPIFTQNGYLFDGNSVLVVYFDEPLPSFTEERTFIFSIYPTDGPNENRPVFFFSYGQRYTHVKSLEDCKKQNSKFSNHDRCFGMFWGEPKPFEKIPQKFKGMGLRVFFYCEHCKKHRISNNCDTPVLYKNLKLNEWTTLAVSYGDNKRLKVYVNGELIHSSIYEISTAMTNHLIIGGFLHHNEKGALIIKDIDYSMRGYIREFLMFRRVLEDEEIREISEKIKGLLR